MWEYTLTSATREMTPDSHDPATEIIRADPRHKKLTLAAVVLVLLSGIGVIAVLEPYLAAFVADYEAGIADRSPEELMADYRRFSLIASAGFAVPASLVGAAILYQGYRIHRSGRYPYPGMMLLRDAPLETGPRARRRTKRLIASGGLVIVAGYGLGWYVFSLLMRIAESALGG